MAADEAAEAAEAAPAEAKEDVKTPEPEKKKEEVVEEAGVALDVKETGNDVAGGDDVEEDNYGDMTIEEALKKLDTTREGLSNEEAQARIERYGFNELPHEEVNKCLQFLSFMWNPLSWVMEAAAIVAIILSNGPEPYLFPHSRFCDSTSGNSFLTNCPPIPEDTGGGFPAPDYPDFVGIVLLLFANSCIGYYEESKAGDAVSALMAGLAPKCWAKRGGEFVQLESKELVPGDIITIKLGDIIPADCKVLEGEPLKVDQAGLTGESLPVTKDPGDEIYSSCTVKRGEIDCVVFATGVHTFFGKAANLVAETEEGSHLQEVLAAIGTFCMSYIGTWIVIMVIIMYAVWSFPYRAGINMVLVVLIGGIPIAMPTVLSVTMALGVGDLAKKDAIVTRITAVEVMAGMDILCSDKTGTLTKNELSVDEPELMDGFTREEMMKYAALSAKREGDPDAIDKCITDEAVKAGLKLDEYTEDRFVPFDPVNKRTEAWLTHKTDGKKMVCSKGAPQVMINLAHNAEEIREEQEKIIDDYARRGLRAIGVAVRKGVEEEDKWEFVGLISLLDPPRDDTKKTIEEALRLGVEVKMITGDQVAIGKDTAERLGMGTKFYNAHIIRQEFVDGIPIGQIVEEADGFGEVFPEDKYKVVDVLRKMNTGNGPFGGPHVVGMTGDGVNDAPALKVSDVGIAVDGATDAARAAADMVLLTPGLNVIIAAIIGSRKIFQRMKNYAMYACATTIRIVTTFGILVCAWQFQFPPFMVLIIAYLNDGTILTISRDNADPSPKPDAWRLKELFSIGFVIGLYLTISTIVFWVVIIYTPFFDNIGKGPLPAIKADTICNFYTIPSVQNDAYAQATLLPPTAGFPIIDQTTRAPISYEVCNNNASQEPALTECANLLKNQNNGLDINGNVALPYAQVSNQLYNNNNDCLSAYAATAGNNLVSRRTNAIIYLQVSITGQLVIFSTRARLWFFTSMPSYWLMAAFVVAQLVATFITVYANWPFTAIAPTDWGWAAICWVWSIIWFLPIDIFKIGTYWILYGNPWAAALENKAAMAIAFNNPLSRKSKAGSKLSKAERKALVLNSQKKMGVRMSKKGKR